MRIAISFPGCHRFGGVERIAFECAKFLSGRGHDIEVYAQKWEPMPESGVRFHTVPDMPLPWFLKGANYFVRCSRILEKANYDVLNTHGCICPTGGVHWVQSIQKAWLETSRRLRHRLSWGSLRQRLNPLHPVLLALEEKHFRERRYRKLIATTAHIQTDLHRLYGVPLEDVEVIPNGFSPEEFNPIRRLALRDEMRRELNLDPDHIALIFVANELPRKGYGTLLRAIKMVDHKKLRLMVLGRADRSEVLRQANDHGLGGQVIACGSTGDIGRFHAAADVFVLPTQYEAFCLAILEALGSGLPVVTTRVPGAQNAIQCGINGELVDVDNAEELAAALRGLCDVDRRSRLSQQAPPSVKDYQWPSVLAKYERVLVEQQ